MPAFKLMNRHNKVNSPPAGSWWQKKNKVNQYTSKLRKKNSSEYADDKCTRHNKLNQPPAGCWWQRINFEPKHCKTQKKIQALKLMTKHNKVNLPPAGSRWQKKNKVRAIHPKTQKKNSSKSADDKRTQHNYLTNLQKKFWTNLPQNSEENFSVYADDKRSRYNKFNQPPAGCWRQRWSPKPKHCKDQKKTPGNTLMTNVQATTNLTNLQQEADDKE